jgi:hypothetical protein
MSWMSIRWHGFKKYLSCGLLLVWTTCCVINYMSWMSIRWHGFKKYLSCGLLSLDNLLCDYMMMLDVN